MGKLNLDEAPKVQGTSAAGVSGSSKQNQIKLRKRRFKEIEKEWDLNIDQDTKSVIAIQNDQKSEISDTISSSSRKKRHLKLKEKTLNKMSQEAELARGRNKETKGISE